MPKKAVGCCGQHFVLFGCSSFSSLGRRQVPYEEISNLEFLGKGNQGVVYKGRFGERSIALKTFLSDPKTDDYRLFLLDHTNLIKFLLVICIFFSCRLSQLIFFFEIHQTHDNQIYISCINWLFQALKI